MGRIREMTTFRHWTRAALLSGATLLATGCAVFGGGPGEEPGGPAATAESESPRRAAAAEADSAPPPGSIAALMAAHEYDAVLAAYAADSTLHTNETATYSAGVAAAMSGHEGYDPRRAATLFERLLREHPDTGRRTEVELYLEMLARERDLRTTVGRLDKELKQLKAIDLGQAPGEGEP